MTRYNTRVTLDAAVGHVPAQACHSPHTWSLLTRLINSQPLHVVHPLPAPPPQKFLRYLCAHLLIT
jgi:hypothetical protein